MTKTDKPKTMRDKKDEFILAWGFEPTKVGQKMRENVWHWHIEAEKRLLKEAIELSDRIEAGKETKFEEWKAFKHFRNALRDKLQSLVDEVEETK